MFNWLKKNYLVFSLVVLGAIVRFWYLFEPFSYSVNITPDEAVYGLQALHALKGEHSIFYWAQPYTGTFSAYLSAFFFLLSGPSSLFLKLVPFLFSVGFIYLNYLIAKKVTNDNRVAVATLIITALGTPFWNNWSSRAGSGYPEATFVGNLILLTGLSLIYFSPARRHFSFFCLGFLSGFGFWLQPTIVYYVFPVYLFLFLKNPKYFLGKEILSLLFGIFLGGLPVIYWNTQFGGGTGNALLHLSIRGLKRALAGLVFDGFPVILGIRSSFSRENFFTPIAITIILLNISAMVFFLGQRISHIKNIIFNFSKSSVPMDLIGATFFSTLSIFLFTEKFNQFVIEPRYILALYSTCPLILAIFANQLAKTQRILFSLSVVFFLANWVFGLLKAPPSSFVDYYKLDTVLKKISAQKVVFVNSEGALAHRLMFLSNESVIASVREGGLMAARYPKYNQEVLDAPWDYKGFVILKNNPDAKILENEMRSFVPGYKREEIGNRFVILSP